MTKTFTLKRVSHNDYGTYGVIIDETTPFALTLENPWHDNHQEKSCIPAGVYTCKRTYSPRHGETFEILDVPYRSEILFHIGNTQVDTYGCILIGEQFEPLYGAPAILQSRKGFNEFMRRLVNEDEFTLVITWV